MKVLFCGSRHWTNVDAIMREMSKLPPDTEIIHGGARGADTIAGEVAAELGLSVRVFPADWSEYGRAAGHIRNQQMIKEKPDLVLAFTENLVRSRGTADMVRRAKAHDVEVDIFNE